MHAGAPSASTVTPSGLPAWATRVTGLLAFAVIALGLWMTLLRPARPAEALPGGYMSHMMAFELARTADEARRVLASDPATAALLRRQLQVDFAYIWAYWLLFLAIGARLVGCHRPAGAWLAGIGAAAITAGALFDGLENTRLLALLDTPPAALTDLAVLAAREASLLKWALVFVAAGALAPSYLWAAGRAWLIGILFVAVSLLGLYGLWHNQAIEWALLLFSPGSLATAILFTFFPDRVRVGAACRAPSR